MKVIDINVVLRWVRDHPKCVSSVGEFDSVYECLYEESGDLLFVGRKAIILPSWVIIRGGWFGNSYTLVPTSRLLWSYVKKTNNWLILGFIPIPTGHDFYVVIHSYDSDTRIRSFEVETDEDGSSRMILLLATVAPWHVVGYSKEVERAWGKDKAQFFRARGTASRFDD